MIVETLEIADRFRGPPKSGNGGYVCGHIARHLSGPVAVRLKAPPPLGTPLRLESSGGQARLLDGDAVIGEARPAALDIEPPPPPSYAQAQAATPKFIGFNHHPFPGCFVCGPERAPADGLRIFPGPVDGTPVLAAPWTPDVSLGGDAGAVRPEFLWAALDCTGAFTVFPLPDRTAIVLGELCAALPGALAVGEPGVVTAWPLGADGRKHFAGSAVHGADGRLVAFARAVWIEVPANNWS